MISFGVEILDFISNEMENALINAYDAIPLELKKKLKINCSNREVLKFCMKTGFTRYNARVKHVNQKLKNLGANERLGCFSKKDFVMAKNIVNEGGSGEGLTACDFTYAINKPEGCENAFSIIKLGQDFFKQIKPNLVEVK